jgi:uncharacterized flavoprotein (TIGR03862 family)
MAAQACAEAGVAVDVYDAMPSVGRKFLLAGKGGLNLTHAEPPAAFKRRYGEALPSLQPHLDAFGAAELRAWAHGLAIETFVGSSGRVFPREMKAAPLLRAWLKRLRQAGVTFHSRHRWDGRLAIPTADGRGGSTIRLGMAINGTPKQATSGGDHSRDDAGQVMEVEAEAVVLALGGGSWPRLGSDGAWLPLLLEQGVAVAPLAPANCGFDCAWSEHFSSRWAGAPVKSAAMSLAPPASGHGADRDQGAEMMKRGEFVITATGIEGSLVYALSAPARDRIQATASAVLHLDLLPDRSQAWILAALQGPRGGRSMANHLRRSIGLEGVKAALLRECVPGDTYGSPGNLASAIKRLPVKLLAPRPLQEAISSAGGVRFEALDDKLMLRRLPGVFCAGEMLDWEAPTGGYLLTACFATGRAAGLGGVEWLASRTTGARQAAPAA